VAAEAGAGRRLVAYVSPDPVWFGSAGCHSTNGGRSFRAPNGIAIEPHIVRAQPHWTDDSVDSRSIPSRFPQHLPGIFGNTLDQ